MRLVRCTQCGEYILPDENFLDEFQVGEHAPVHEECGPLLILDEERANFWFDWESESEEESNPDKIDRVRSS